MYSLSLSRDSWGIKRIGLIYQNDAVCIGVLHCLGLSTALGARIFLYLIRCVGEEYVKILKKTFGDIPLLVVEDGHLE